MKLHEAVRLEVGDWSVQPFRFIYGQAGDKFKKTDETLNPKQFKKTEQMVVDNQ